MSRSGSNHLLLIGERLSFLASKRVFEKPKFLHALIERADECLTFNSRVKKRSRNTPIQSS